MINLPINIQDRKDQTYVVPRLGIDLPYWRIYLTDRLPYYVKITGAIEGAVNANYLKYFVPTTWDSYEDYDALGYYLINADASEAYEIDEILGVDEWITTVEDKPEDASATYYIAKYYQSLITQSPTLQQSSKRHGEMATIGSINFTVSNIQEPTITSKAGLLHTTSVFEMTSDINLAANVGKHCIVQCSNNLTKEYTITDVTGNYITVDKDTAGTGATATMYVFTDNFLTDLLATYPNIEESSLSAYIILAEAYDDNVFELSEQMRRFDGFVENFESVGEDKFSITAYDKEEFLSIDKIGNLITEADGVLINGATVESLGEMKPITFGKSEVYEQIDTTAPELNSFQNNMAKLKYLGLDAESGKKKYLLSQNAVVVRGSAVSGRPKFTDSIYYKNPSGRLCKITDSDISVSFDAVTGDNVLVEINNNIEITDYWFGTGVVNDVTPAEGAAPHIVLEDTEYSCDNDATSYAKLTIQPYDSGTQYIQYWDVAFNDYDTRTISISRVEVYAYYAMYYGAGTVVSSGLLGGFLDINGTTKYGTQSTPTSAQFGTDSATRAGILSDVRITCAGQDDVDSAGDRADRIYEIYEVYKKIISTIDTIEEDIELYAIYDGYKYDGTWNSRQSGGANPNGGYYSYTHDNWNSSDTIENPIGMIEAVLRDTTFGMSKTNADLDLDTFNRASIARTGWKFAFQVQEQQDAKSFLNNLLMQSCATLYERDGKIAIHAYDSSAPFTHNYFSGDGGEFLAVSSIVFTDGMRIQTKFRLDNISTFRGICGRGAHYAYIRINTDGKLSGETDSDGDAFGFDYVFAVDTWYEIELLCNGDEMMLYVNGTYIGIDIVSNPSISIINIMRGYLNNGTTDLVGDMEYFRVIDADGDTELNIICRNEKIYDTTGTRAVTLNGTITYSLAGGGIYEYGAWVTNDEFVNMPIVEGSFTYGKVTDEIANKIIANYYKNNDTGNTQATATYTDSTYSLSNTLEKEIEFNLVSDATTLGYIKTIMLKTHGKKAYYTKFSTGSSGIDLELFDIINVRHPLLRNVFTMNTKKWLVVDLEFDTTTMQTTITAVELL